MFPRLYVIMVTLLNSSVEEDACTEPSARVTLPYVQEISEAIQRVLGMLDIRTSFKPPGSLRDLLSHPKDPYTLA